MNDWREGKRFEEVHSQGGIFTALKVMLDTETGVQYLQWASGNAGGMTVLVDKDGKPLLYRGYER